MLISITRLSVREKRGYHTPARYSTTTYCIVSVDGLEKHRFSIGAHGNYKKCVEAVKRKYGESEQYLIDSEKPYVHYI